MCLAIPLRLVEVNGNVGKVDVGGATREVGLHLIEDPQPGDYLLVHAGFAIQKLDEEEAQKTLALWQEIAQRMEGSDEVR
jgi:hydrogenase expression/formation protein HypC